MFYAGESNVPGAAGNIAGNPSFDIRRGPGALGGRSEEQIRRLQQNLPENQQLLDEMRRRGITPGGGPQLPLAYGSSNLPGAVGNMAGILNAELAQAMPKAAALGGQMGMAPQEQRPGMMGPNVFSVRPRASYLEPEEGGLDLGGAINIPLGPNGRINVQGGYQPGTGMLNAQGSIGQPQGAPGFGVDLFVRRNLNRRNNPSDVMGMPMNDMGGQVRYETQF